MMKITEKAYAKINLTLDIVGDLPGGYHELCSVMQSTTLCDILEISLQKGDGRIETVTDKSYLPTGEKNLAGRAARLFLDKLGVTDADVSIKIEKNIPVGAGLGGGSADAAAVLRGMNKLFSSPFTACQLEEIGGSFGSDIPFCIQGGTVLARGRGEIMEAVAPMPGCGLLLCKPAFSVSTAELFALADKRKIITRPDTQGLLRALEAGDVSGVAHRLYNVFEEVTVRGRDQVGRIKEMMYDRGALGASMSGTGPTVFGIFPDLESAHMAQDALSRHWKDCAACSPAGRIAF